MKAMLKFRLDPNSIEVIRQFRARFPQMTIGAEPTIDFGDGTSIHCDTWEEFKEMAERIAESSTRPPEKRLKEKTEAIQPEAVVLLSKQISEEPSQVVAPELPVLSSAEHGTRSYEPFIKLTSGHGETAEVSVATTASAAQK